MDAEFGYKREFQQLWNDLASERDSQSVFAQNKNIVLYKLVYVVHI